MRWVSWLLYYSFTFILFYVFCFVFFCQFQKLPVSHAKFRLSVSVVSYIFIQSWHTPYLEDTRCRNGAVLVEKPHKYRFLFSSTLRRIFLQKILRTKTCICSCVCLCTESMCECAESDRQFLLFELCAWIPYLHGLTVSSYFNRCPLDSGWRVASIDPTRRTNKSRAYKLISRPGSLNSHWLTFENIILHSVVRTEEKKKNRTLVRTLYVGYYTQNTKIK